MGEEERREKRMGEGGRWRGGQMNCMKNTKTVKAIQERVNYNETLHILK